MHTFICKWGKVPNKESQGHQRNLCQNAMQKTQIFWHVFCCQLYFLICWVTYMEKRNGFHLHFRTWEYSGDFSWKDSSLLKSKLVHVQCQQEIFLELWMTFLIKTRKDIFTIANSVFTRAVGDPSRSCWSEWGAAGIGAWVSHIAGRYLLKEAYHFLANPIVFWKSNNETESSKSQTSARCGNSFPTDPLPWAGSSFRAVNGRRWYSEHYRIERLVTTGCWLHNPFLWLAKECFIMLIKIMDPHQGESQKFYRRQEAHISSLSLQMYMPDNRRALFREWCMLEAPGFPVKRIYSSYIIT